MNQSQAKEWLPLIQALAEGKTIQANIQTDDNPKWETVSKLNFSFHVDAYRIKPEPKKAWYRVALLKDGGGYWTKAIGCEDYHFLDDKGVTFIHWLTDRIEYELPEGEA